MTERYDGDEPRFVAMDTRARLHDLIARARKRATKDALTALIYARRPDRDAWLAAEKLVWADVPLTTADAMWVRRQALAMPSRHARTEEVANE